MQNWIVTFIQDTILSKDSDFLTINRFGPFCITFCTFFTVGLVFFFFAVVTNKNDMVCHKKSCNQQLTKVVDPHSTYYTCIFGLPLVYIVDKDNTYGYCGHYSAHVVIILDWLEVLTQLEFLYLFIPDVNKIKWC